MIPGRTFCGRPERAGGRADRPLRQSCGRQAGTRSGEVTLPGRAGRPGESRHRSAHPLTRPQGRAAGSRGRCQIRLYFPVTIRAYAPRAEGFLLRDHAVSARASTFGFRRLAVKGEQLMAQGTVDEGRTSHRGFASMNAERQRRLRAWVARRYRMRSAASRRTAAWRPRRDARADRASRARSAASPRIAIWPRSPGARADRACRMRSAASRSTRSWLPRPAARADRPATAAAGSRPA